MIKAIRKIVLQKNLTENNRGNSGKADMLRFRKKNDIVKIKIKNLFYFYNSINGINFEIK